LRSPRAPGTPGHGRLGLGAARRAAPMPATAAVSAGGSTAGSEVSGWSACVGMAGCRGATVAAGSPRSTTTSRSAARPPSPFAAAPDARSGLSGTSSCPFAPSCLGASLPSRAGQQQAALAQHAPMPEVGGRSDEKESALARVPTTITQSRADASRPRAPVEATSGPAASRLHHRHRGLQRRWRFPSAAAVGVAAGDDLRRCPLLHAVSGAPYGPATAPPTVRRRQP
jgi:hypothetical protein